MSFSTLIAVLIGQIIGAVIINKMKLGFTPTVLFGFGIGSLLLAAYDSISAQYVAPPSHTAWGYIVVALIDFAAAAAWEVRLIVTDPRTRRS